jgi:hypothetical protein
LEKAGKGHENHGKYGEIWGNSARFWDMVIFLLADFCLGEGW